MLYLVNHTINNYILLNYGSTEKVDGEERYTDNYVSQLLRIITSITFFIMSVLILIQIWDLTELLESGSAFVTIGIVLFATKEFWLEEVMSSLTIHAKGKLKRGSIIELEDGEMYVILESNFIGTRLRNLKTKVETVVPNKSFIRNCVKLYTIEKENTAQDKKGKQWKPTKQSISFNIGYNVTYDKVSEYFNDVMEQSIKDCNYIGSYEIILVNNGDHAVTWEILYHLNNPFHIANAKNIINLNAFKLQEKFNIDLSTPLTYSKI